MSQRARGDRKEDLERREVLQRFFTSLIENGSFRTHREIALEMKTTEVNLSQVLREPGRFLSVEQCLRLAGKIDEYPGEVLRKAGRPEMADIIDALWPRERNFIALTRGERELIQQWRKIPTLTRRHLVALVAINAALAVRLDGPRGPAPRASRASRPKLLRVVPR